MPPRAYILYKECDIYGVLPTDGGYLDQPEALIQQMRVVATAEMEHNLEKRQSEAAKRALEGRNLPDLSESFDILK